MTGVVIKRRSFTNLRAFQLLGEARAARVLHQAMPKQIQEYHLVIPDVTARVCRKGVLITTGRLEGQRLIEKIYQAVELEEAVRIAALVFWALYQADICWWWGRCLGRVYPFVRSQKVHRLQSRDLLELTEQQRLQLNRVLRSKAGQHGTHLVHGDLHAGNILVDHGSMQVGLVDLELAHIGSPAVDFCALWSSFFLAAPELGQQFYRSARQLVPELDDKLLLEAIYCKLVKNSYLLVHKGLQDRNSLLADRARTLLLDLLDLSHLVDFHLFLRSEAHQHAS